jgi:hypothetical protein
MPVSKCESVKRKFSGKLRKASSLARASSPLECDILRACAKAADRLARRLQRIVATDIRRLLANPERNYRAPRLIPPCVSSNDRFSTAAVCADPSLNAGKWKFAGAEEDIFRQSVPLLRRFAS